MASNAGPGGSPNAPAGQPADDDATGELVIDVDAGTATAPLERPGCHQPLNGPAHGVAAPSSDDTHPNGRVAGTQAGWPAPPPALRADGWDAESTAAWDPASSWAVEENEEPEEGTVGPWDEVPDWEGEIVTWEADRPDARPGQLARPDGAETELTGAPTAPPGYAGEYLPAHLSRADDAVALYAGRGAPATAVGGVYDRKGALRTKRDRGPWRELVIITAVAVIVSAVILAVTTAEKSNVAGLDSIFGSPRTTAGAASPSATAGAATDRSPALSSTTLGTGTALSAAPKAGTSAPLSQQPKSLPVTAGVAQSLVKSWLASNPGGYGMSPADVAGTVPNEVYYAVQPTTGTYWAMAAFKPSPTLTAQSSTETGQGELAEFHDSVYAFSWQAGPVWTVLGEFSTGSCPSVWVPRAVLAVWGLCGL